MIPKCIERERKAIAERTAVILESLSPQASTEFQRSLEQEIAAIRLEISRAAEMCRANLAYSDRGSINPLIGYDLYC